VRVDASLVALQCLLSVALSTRWRISPIIISCDVRYSLPRPLLATPSATRYPVRYSLPRPLLATPSATRYPVGYLLPRPLIRFSQTSLTYRLSDPSRLQRAAPFSPVNGQSNSHLTTGFRPIPSRLLSTTQLTSACHEDFNLD